MAAGDTLIGRRLPVVGESWTVPERPGDYCGPFPAMVDGFDLCYFLLPIARNDDGPPGYRSIHSVHFPPHSYRECEDGSLEIRASIMVRGARNMVIWHGFLDEGHVWREA